MGTMGEGGGRNTKKIVNSQISSGPSRALIMTTPLHILSFNSNILLIP